METPCPRCGHHKTESVRRGFMYNTFWNMGYHLRACSFCNRWRLFKLTDRSQPHPDDMTVEELQESFNRKIAESLRKDSTATELPQAMIEVGPAEETQRSEPQPVEVPFRAAIESLEAEPHPAEISIGVVEEPHQAEFRSVEASLGVAEAPREAESDNYRLCPKCGGTNFRRSRRRWWERMIKRPRMARCMKCSHRFPYPI